MTLGWRGVMTKYSGFYDLPTAWNQVFWGILLGGAFASYADSSLFLPYYEANLSGERTAELNVLRLFLIPLIATIGMHFLLRRKRVRKGGSQSTSGWALGLAVGGMLSIVLITRKVQSGIAGPVDVLTILLIGFFAPRIEAIITAYHGTLMLRGKRWGAIFRATFWRASSLQCCTSHGLVHFLGSSSCLQFFWCKIRQKNGSGILSQKKVVEDGVECRQTKSAKNKHLRGLFTVQTMFRMNRSKFSPKDLTYQWFGRSSHTIIKP